MAIIEVAGSGTTTRAGKQSAYELQFHLKGYANNAAAMAALVGADTGTVPASVSVDGFSLAYRQYSIRPKGNGSFQTGIVRYRHVDSEEAGEDPPLEVTSTDEELVLDFTTEVKTVRHATESTGHPIAANNNNKAIGMHPITGHIQGTEVEIPLESFTLTKLIPAATVTDAWLVARRDKLGRINNATFRSRPAETVRFMRMQGRQRRKNGDFTFSFTFQGGTIIEDFNIQDLGINVSGSAALVDIYPFRHYELITKGFKQYGTSPNIYIGPNPVNFIEHKLAEMAPVDLSTVIP